ncbi:MAG: hypothetical protein LBR34_10415, partial [Prevotella sp.]|nr:hypothetical protein [Prevotella sp.]
MKTVKSLLLMCALPLLAAQAYAQSPTTVYDATALTLPTSQSWTEQKLDQSVNTVAAVTGADASTGVLKLTSTNAADQFSQLSYYQTGLGLNLATGYTIEIKAKVTAADKTGAFNVQGYDNEGKGFRIGILADKLTNLSSPLSATTVVASGLDNTDDFHTFRFAFNPDGTVDVYRDGTLVGDFLLSTFEFDNYIEDGGFEDGTYTDFISNGILSIKEKATDPKKVCNGEKSLELYNNGLVTDGWTNIENARTRNIAIKPNQDYQFYINRRRSLNDDTWCWRDGGMFYNGQPGTLAGQDDRGNRITWLAFDYMWQTHPQDFTTPAMDADHQSVRLEFPTWYRESVKNQNTTALDNVILRERPIQAIGGTTTVVEQGFPTPAPVFPASYTNLIINGDFEDAT